MNHHHYDAIVVGARVAGATTAMLMGRAGLRVLVIDRAREGSDTLSTHALMRGGVIQLSRFGVLDDVIAAGTPPIRRTVIRYGPDEEIVDIRPGDHVDALYAPRRDVLDPLLVRAARAAGVEFRFRTALADLLRDDEGRVIGVATRDERGLRSEMYAPITIGADGVRSRVAREVGALTYSCGRNAGAMVVAYVAGVDADGYQWLYGDRASAGVIPTNDGEVCVWAGLPSGEAGPLRHEEDLGLSRILRAVAPDWAEAVAGGVRRGPVRGFPGIPGFLRQPWGRGWALVGDAAYFKDPLTTHGMTDALRDAELLARAVIATTGDDVGLDDALACYQDTRDRLSHDLLDRTDRVASYAWDLTELRPLLLEVSAAMRPTVQHLLALDAAPSAAAGVA